MPLSRELDSWPRPLSQKAYAPTSELVGGGLIQPPHPPAHSPLRALPICFPFEVSGEALAAGSFMSKNTGG